MSNYPPGSDTPDAPWNTKEPSTKTCEECDGTGIDTEKLDECLCCDGQGYVEIETEDNE